MMERILFIMTLITVVTCQVTPVKPGVPFSGSTQFKSWTYYTIPASEATINYVQMVAKVQSGVPFFYINIDSPPTFLNHKWKSENTSVGDRVEYAFSPNIDYGSGNITNGLIYLGVYGYSETKCTITLNPQGPIMFTDRKILASDFPVPDGYMFYKFKIDDFVRKIQIYAEAGPSRSTIFFVVDNSTLSYPFFPGVFKYGSNDNWNGSGWSSCLEINYPYPGYYRVSVRAQELPYKIQYVENNFKSCQFEF